jgi:hypothetical protein
MYNINLQLIIFSISIICLINSLLFYDFLKTLQCIANECGMLFFLAIISYIISFIFGTPRYNSYIINENTTIYSYMKEKYPLFTIIYTFLCILNFYTIYLYKKVSITQVNISYLVDLSFFMIFFISEKVQF